MPNRNPHIVGDSMAISRIFQWRENLARWGSPFHKTSRTELILTPCLGMPVLDMGYEIHINDIKHINEVVLSVTVEMMSRTWLELRSRLVFMLENNGNHIEIYKHYFFTFHVMRLIWYSEIGITSSCFPVFTVLQAGVNCASWAVLLPFPPWFSLPPCDPWRQPLTDERVFATLVDPAIHKLRMLVQRVMVLVLHNGELFR